MTVITARALAESGVPSLRYIGAEGDFALIMITEGIPVVEHPRGV